MLYFDIFFLYSGLEQNQSRGEINVSVCISSKLNHSNLFSTPFFPLLKGCSHFWCLLLVRIVWWAWTVAVTRCPRERIAGAFSFLARRLHQISQVQRQSLILTRSKIKRRSIYKVLIKKRMIASAVVYFVQLAKAKRHFNAILPSS